MIHILNDDWLVTFHYCQLILVSDWPIAHIRVCDRPIAREHCFGNGPLYFFFTRTLFIRVCMLLSRTEPIYFYSIYFSRNK